MIVHHVFLHETQQWLCTQQLSCILVKLLLDGKQFGFTKALCCSMKLSVDISELHPLYRAKFNDAQSPEYFDTHQNLAP